MVKVLYTLSSKIKRKRDYKDGLKTSPSLKRYFAEVFDGCYQDRREQAADETGLLVAIFLIKSPFTPSETLDSDYLPDF